MAGPIKMLQSKEAIGRRILEAFEDSSQMDQLKNDPAAYFSGYIDTNGHTLVAHPNNSTLTNIIIPFEEFLMDPVTDYVVPPEYHPDHAINQPGEEERAYAFRMGDYIFAQCG